MLAGTPSSDSCPNSVPTPKHSPGTQAQQGSWQRRLCCVPGCTEALQAGYSEKYRICLFHKTADSFSIDSKQCRFCQQARCGKTHPLEEFDGGRHSCQPSLERHQRNRLARRKERAAGLPPPQRRRKQQAQPQQRGEQEQEQEQEQPPPQSQLQQEQAWQQARLVTPTFAQCSENSYASSPLMDRPRHLSPPPQQQPTGLQPFGPVPEVGDLHELKGSGAMTGPPALTQVLVASAPPPLPRPVPVSSLQAVPALDQGLAPKWCLGALDAALVQLHAEAWQVQQAQVVQEQQHQQQTWMETRLLPLPVPLPLLAVGGQLGVPSDLMHLDCQLEATDSWASPRLVREALSVLECPLLDGHVMLAVPSEEEMMSISEELGITLKPGAAPTVRTPTSATATMTVYTHPPTGAQLAPAASHLPIQQQQQAHLQAAPKRQRLEAPAWSLPSQPVPHGLERASSCSCGWDSGLGAAALLCGNAFPSSFTLPSFPLEESSALTGATNLGLAGYQQQQQQQLATAGSVGMQTTPTSPWHYTAADAMPYPPPGLPFMDVEGSTSNITVAVRQPSNKPTPHSNLWPPPGCAGAGTVAHF